jgi:TolB-like protein/DNA-binding winged helix-turn-helix (wHTH) protein/Tfp pilus assembly protein PilF
MTFRTSARTVYSFGPFQVDVENCEILKHGIRLHFQNQPGRVLRLLLERPGQLVSREELQKELWPELPACDTEDSLNSTVKKLRETLGDDPGKPLYMETIPRKGYRFIAPVKVETLEPSGTVRERLGARTGWLRHFVALGDNSREGEQPWLRRHRVFASLGALALIAGVTLLSVTRFMKRAAAASQIHSMVVLPFENLSGDAGQEYFAEGLTDAVTTDLAQFGSIKVISRTSANHYKKNPGSIAKIRQELGVDAVVEGSVARSGGKVRVNAQLISAADDRHIWAQSFVRDEEDILSLQEDLARSVAGKIQTAISPEQHIHASESHPVNIQAYEAYLTGLHDLNTHRTNEDLRKSLEEFKQAVVLDPNLAKAYAGEAQTYNLLGDYDEMEGREAGPKAEAAARRALELDASLASAHAALAFALWKYSWLWSDAEAEFQKSLALNSNNAHTHHTYGVFLACRSDFASADEHLRKALTLDPLSMIIRTNLGWLEYFQHNYAKAEAAYLQVLELDPSFLTARQKLWITYALEGKTQQAEAELENVMRLFGNLDLLERVEKSSPAARFQVAVSSYIESGLLTPYERARYLALLGRGREAVQALQEAQQQQSAWMVYLRIEPVFDRIRTTPGFDQLVRNARIPEAKALSAKN